MEVLRTDKLTKKFKNKFAVKDVSMVINEGDIYGFIGENGAGKTTFIRLIAGLANPTSGTYTLFEGENKPIAAIVEAPALYLNLTALDNMRAYGKLVGIQDEQKFRELLELVKLNEVIDSKKKANHFSLGMKQRLGIAMALLDDPKFLILDEPMNGLDPEGVYLLRNIIKDLSEKGITFLISSHMLSELSKIATKYGFIHQGELVKEATLKDLENLQRHYIHVEIDSSQRELARKILTKAKFNFDDDDNIKVYDAKLDDVFSLLRKNKIEVKAIKEETPSIEDFYLKLIGELNG